MNNMMAASVVPIPSALPGTSYFDDTALTWGPVPAANGLRNVLNGLVQLTGTQWRGINGSVNATSVEFLMDTTPITGGLGQFAVKLASAGVSTANVICWMQGEGNTNLVPFQQERFYQADLDTMHANLAAMMGKTKATLPLIVAGLTTYGDTDFPNTDNSWSTIRNALFNSTAQLTNTFFSHSNMDGTRIGAVNGIGGDVYHLDPISCDRNGARFAQTLKFVLGHVGTPAHWEISNAVTVDATHTTVNLGLVGTATDFTPTSGITGFQATGNNGATWVTCTAVRASATSITLTHASLSTANVRKIRYQYGMLPDVTAPVQDNSTLALPLGFTRDALTPTPLSTVPRPDYWGNAYDDNQTGTTQSNAGIPIGPAAPRRLVIAGLGGSIVPFASVTITPNVGTAKPATIIQGPTNNSAALAYALLDADADTAVSVTVSVTYSSSPFSRTQMDVWTILSSQLNSTTPTATQAPAFTASATVATLNIATSAGGVVIATARQTGTSVGGVISGTEAYANRDNPQAFVINVSADSCNNSSSASSAITATFGSSGNISLAAAAWR